MPKNNGIVIIFRLPYSNRPLVSNRTGQLLTDRASFLLRMHTVALPNCSRPHTLIKFGRARHSVCAVPNRQKTYQFGSSSSVRRSWRDTFCSLAKYFAFLL